MPELFIGMPAYNAEAKIASVLESLLNQSYSDFHLFISDNASSDRTEEICRDYARQDHRITYYRQEKNLGAIDNYNFVACKADTPFFKWHASNDSCDNDMLERCVALLREDPEIALAFPQTMLVYADGAEPELYDDRIECLSTSPVERFLCVIDNMRLNNVLNGVIRRSMLQRSTLMGQFYYADRNLVAELALHGKLVLVPECRFYRGMDAESATKYKSKAEILAHHNPERRYPQTFANWRAYYRYFMAVTTSGVGWREKGRGYYHLLWRFWWARNKLLGDVSAAIRYSARDMRAAIRSLVKSS